MSNRSRREALRAQQRAQAEAARKKRIIVVTAIAAAFVLLLVGGGYAIWLNRDSISAGGGATPPDANDDASGIILYKGTAKPGARKVVVYQDYQCPWCKTFDQAFSSELLTRAKAGDIQLEYHTMTFLDTNLRNDASTRASVAASCADFAGQEQYVKMHDAIYANQPTTEGIGYSDQLLREQLPAQVGITGDALISYQRCYDNKSTKGFVVGMNDKAGRAGVTGTPTYFVDGTNVTDQLDYRDPTSIAKVLG